MRRARVRSIGAGQCVRTSGLTPLEFPGTNARKHENSASNANRNRNPTGTRCGVTYHSEQCKYECRQGGGGSGSQRVCNASHLCFCHGSALSFQLSRSARKVLSLSVPRVPLKPRIEAPDHSGILDKFSERFEAGRHAESKNYSVDRRVVLF